MHKCVDNSVGNIYHLEQMVDNFFPYSQKQLGFDENVEIVFQSDENNSSKMLGKTAYYDPCGFQIVLYVDGRHPKDVLRSLSHELVHHAQNCRGDFAGSGGMQPGYAQEDTHLRKMEREAYTKGNLIFRDFEDLIKTGKINIEIDFSDSGEPKMSLKEWKNNEINTKLMKKWGLLKEGNIPAAEHAAEFGINPRRAARVQGWVARRFKELGDLNAVLAAAEEDSSIGDPEMFAIQAEVDKLRAEGGGSEEGTHFAEGGVVYRDEDEDPLDRPTRRRDNPLKALSAKDYEGIAPKAHGDEEGNRPSMARDMDLKGGRVTRGASSRLGKRRNLGGTYRTIKQEKISVREAREITRRIIERIKQESK